MAESNVFEWLSATLEKHTSLSRLEARGTLRLVLKAAGLDPASVRTHQMQVVIERMMPGALKKRGVEGAEAVCRELASELRARGALPNDPTADTPSDVFERLDNEATRRPKR